jgi:hypothetical protein
VRTLRSRPAERGRLPSFIDCFGTSAGRDA